MMKSLLAVLAMVCLIGSNANMSNLISPFFGKSEENYDAYSFDAKKRQLRRKSRSRRSRSSYQPSRSRASRSSYRPKRSTYTPKRKSTAKVTIRKSSYTPTRTTYRSAARRYVAPKRSVSRTTRTTYRAIRTKRFTSARRTYNSYLRGGRTYARLYSYYLPVGYYNRRGYYSYRYLKTYYDGYGYNFYSGAYGYYETYVRTNSRGVVVVGRPSPLGGIIGGVIVVLCCAICIIWHCRSKGAEIDIEESIVEEEEVVEETVVETVEHHPNMQPQVFTMGQPMQ